MAIEKTERERLEDRISSMKAERQEFEHDWEDIGRLCSPNRTDIRASQTPYSGRRRRRSNTVLQDTASRIAARRLTNGMATGLTSASRPWFKLTTHDPELRDFQPVKEWLQVTEMAIYAFFAKTNYYDATKMQYADLGPMGVGAVLSLEHPEYMGVYHHMPVGTYHLALDDGLRLRAFVRNTAPTVHQLFSIVGGDRAKLSAPVLNAYDKGNYEDRVPCVHVIERNTDVDGKFIDPGVRKPWRSVRFEVGQNDKKIILTKGGFDSQPVTAPRWETSGDQVYCDSSPGFEALGDMRELQLVARRKSRATDIMVKPPLAAPAGLSRTGLSLDPGTINYIDAQSGDVVSALVSQDPRIPGALREDIDWHTRRVNEIFYADLFMAISDMEGVQPRNEQELMYRNEEKLTQLGPVVDRVNIEKLEVDVQRAYTILKNLGMLPPIPDELAGKPLEIEFVSILAQAQKASSNAAIERAARFVGFVAGLFPDAAIKFDAEQAIDEYAASSGTTPTIIRSDELVAQMKAQAQAQAQRAEAAQNAPAMRDAAEAARLLSETKIDDQGTSALQRMLGQ
jgi:hypothetical protein